MDTHSLEDLSLNEMAALQQSSCLSLPERWVQVCLCMGGDAAVLVVLIEETHWPKLLPANSCHRLGGGSGKGKGSGRVWPYVQLQPGKEMVKHRCQGEPCDCRVDRDHGHCIFQPKSWGESKELVGVNRLGKPEEEAVHGVLGTPCCRMC